VVSTQSTTRYRGSIFFFFFFFLNESPIGVTKLEVAQRSVSREKLSDLMLCAIHYGGWGLETESLGEKASEAQGLHRKASDGQGTDV
jgi:hypothetical protein